MIENTCICSRTHHHVLPCGAMCPLLRYLILTVKIVSSLSQTIDVRVAYSFDWNCVEDKSRQVKRKDPPANIFNSVGLTEPCVVSTALRAPLENWPASDHWILQSIESIKLQATWICVLNL